mgnify:CR=1 FL=1
MAVHTGRVPTLSLETWVSIGSLITVLIAIFAVTGRQNASLRSELGQLRSELKGDIGALRDELKGDIGALRDELKGDIGALRHELRDTRTELKGDLARMEGRIETLDGRVYALAAGLRPHLQSTEEADASS